MDQMSSTATTAENRPPIAFAEFVTLVAALMVLTAFGIDSMLPALPAIGESLNVPTPNERQFVITSYLLGFAVTQLAYGPLADRYGRRPVLGVSLLLTLVANVVVALSSSFAMLLLARFITGAALAGSRVISVALVRDCFAGRAMARVMSLVFIVFMAAPVLAPSFGQLVLLFASWRWIFGGIALLTAAVLAWFWLRMPETLHPHARNELSVARILADCRVVFGDRYAVGYTIAVCFMVGGLFGFVNSVQQIVFDVLKVPHLLTLIFACVAGTMAIGSFTNSRLVMKLGMRLISHVALVGVIVISALHLAIAWLGLESLLSFIILQALLMLCFSLCMSNFSSMAMEDMGDVAGTASSLQGFTTTLVGALIGAAVGQAFDGTTVPLYTGFLLMALCALVVIAITERGRLFRPH